MEDDLNNLNESRGRRVRIPKVDLPGRTPILPPIRAQPDGNRTRMDDLRKVNQKKRRYARALNRVEEQRLQNVNRNVDLAQSLMERTANKQSQKLRRLMDDLEERRQGHYNMIGVTTHANHPSNRVLGDKNTRLKKSPIRQALSSTSCPVLAFSFADRGREPLGRWVRYPRELPALEDTEVSAEQENSSSRNGSVSSTGE